MIKKKCFTHFALVSVLVSVLMLVGCGGAKSADVVGLAQGRWGHTSTLLQDGRVIIIGGQETPGTPRDSAEIYGLDGSWSLAGSMAEKRGEGHTATLLDDGKVLVVGGGFGGSNSTELYDPASNLWSFTGSLATERIEHTATLLKDGKVLVAGGLAGRKDLKAAEIYDPSNGQWTPANKMAEKRQSHKAALLHDGTVLVAGKNSSEIYDPSTDSWSPTGEMVKGKERWGGATLTVLQDGRALLVGGAVSAGAYSELPVNPSPGGAMLSVPASHPMPDFASYSQAEIYDPSTGLWSATSALTKPRKFHTATLMTDGKVLITGDRTAELYDPNANTWTSAGSLNLSRFDWHTASLLPNGTVLVVGGKDGASTYTGTGRDSTGITAAEIYDPAAGWQLLEKPASD